MMKGDRTSVTHYLRRLLSSQQASRLSDAELLERFASQRDETAFEVLMWRHGPKVLGVCRRILHHEQEAEDAFQATFLVLVRKASSIGKRQSVSSWLYRVASHVALRARARATKRTMRQTEIQDVPAAESVPEVVWRDLRPVLDEEVNRLPEKYRVPFVLCYLDGMTNEEAARELGCPKGTILSRLAWARQRLQRRLTHRGVTLSGGMLGASLASDAGGVAVPVALVVSTLRTALRIAAGGTAVGPAAALSTGVLQTMLWAKVNTGGPILFVVILIVLGTATFVQKAGPAQASPMGTNAKAQNSDTIKPPVALRWAPLGRPLYLLVTNPAVQAELKLNASQKKALAAFQAEVVEPLRDWRDLDWPERDRRYAAAKEQTKKGLPKILDGQQLQRLHEIDLQQRGCRGMLADEKIVTKLKLTAEQRRAPDKLTEEEQLKTAQLGIKLLDVNDVYKTCKTNAVYKKNLPEVAEERRGLIQNLVKLHVDSYQRFQAVLTAEQQKQFRAMLGKPCDIAALLAAME